MKKVSLIALSALFVLSGCGAESQEVVLRKEPIPAVESVQEAGKEEASSGDQSDGSGAEGAITQEQALEAIKNYCLANNPDLEGMADSEDYTTYFDVSTNENGEIVVLFRSYTAAQIRYYVDPATGEVYVTELVPGIIDDEQKTDETFNIKDYMGGSAKAPANEGSASGARQDGERFEDVIMLEGMEEIVKYEHVVNAGLGFEIDYDYESLVRKSDSGKESFISIYDDVNSPENYLEVEYRPENIDSVTASISDELSKDYELYIDTYELDHAGNCTRIDASACVGGEVMPEHLQKVYIVPAGNGTIVGTAHYSIESAEGFGHFFDYMINTLIVNA